MSNGANERLTPQGSCPFRFALFSRAVFAGEQNRPLIRPILFVAKRRRERAREPRVFCGGLDAQVEIAASDKAR